MGEEVTARGGGGGGKRGIDGGMGGHGWGGGYLEKKDLMGAFDDKSTPLVTTSSIYIAPVILLPKPLSYF